MIHCFSASLTQAVRNFAKGLEGWLVNSLDQIPKKMSDVKVSLVTVLEMSSVWKRYMCGLGWGKHDALTTASIVEEICLSLKWDFKFRTFFIKGLTEQGVFIWQVTTCSAFAQTLRRYTSLNHLAQAARAVLQNSSQISQMLADLNRVDFANVQVRS